MGVIEYSASALSVAETDGKGRKNPNTVSTLFWRTCASFRTGMTMSTLSYASSFTCGSLIGCLISYFLCQFERALPAHGLHGESFHIVGAWSGAVELPRRQMTKSSAPTKAKIGNGETPSDV